MERINLVIIGNISPSFVRILVDELEKIFSHEFEILARVPVPEECYMEPRGQYDALCMLEQVLRYPGFRIVGLTSVDIAFEGYNFLLGLADRGGRGCIVSTFRLMNTNQERYLERVKKEIMHELGHTFGLGHCENDCVMRFSSTVLDTDLKPARFCDLCSSKIKEHLR